MHHQALQDGLKIQAILKHPKWPIWENVAIVRLVMLQQI